jgi:hypothetical protein
MNLFESPLVLIIIDSPIIDIDFSNQSHFWFGHIMWKVENNEKKKWKHMCKL